MYMEFQVVYQINVMAPFGFRKCKKLRTVDSNFLKNGKFLKKSLTYGRLDCGLRYPPIALI